jgi:hypothetical protein
MILVIGMLIAILTVLILRIGGHFGPILLMDFRKPTIALISYIIIFLALISPIIVEAVSNPCPLSGPGKDPRTGWGG